MATPSFEELVQVYLAQGMPRSEAISLAKQQSGEGRGIIQSMQDWADGIQGTADDISRDTISNFNKIMGTRNSERTGKDTYFNPQPGPLSRVAADAGLNPEISIVSEEEIVSPDSRVLRNLSADDARVKKEIDREIEFQNRPMPQAEEVIKRPLDDQGLGFLGKKRVREKDPLESQLPTRRKFVVRPPKQMIESDQEKFRKRGMSARDRIERPKDLPSGLHYPGEGGRALNPQEQIAPEWLATKQKTWMDKYGKTHTKDGKPLRHTFDPGDPGIGGGTFKRGGTWVDDKGKRHQAGRVKLEAGETDTRTRDQLSSTEERAEYDQMLDAQKEFFVKNFTKEDGTFDWNKLEGASPKIRAAFSHLQHAEAVRQRMQKGARKEELHAEGAREHMYQQAFFTGGIVMPDPERPGAFIVADPRTGDKMPHNPAAQRRIESARQKIANQRRIAENPLKYEAANLRGAKRRMVVESRKLRRQGRNHEAAMLELNIDDPTHPAVLLRAGAFQTPATTARTKGGVIRKGGGVDWEQWNSYAKDWNDKQQSQADMTPAQFARFTMQRGQAGYKAAVADLDSRVAAGTIGRVEAENERAKINRDADAAGAEVRGFNLKPPKPGTMDAKYRRGRDIFSGGSAFGSDIRGHDRWQEWLNLREKMFGPRDKDRQGKTAVSDDLRRSGVADLNHPGAFGRSRGEFGVNEGIMFRSGPRGEREFIDRDVYKNSIADEQRQDMRDRYAHWKQQEKPAGAPAGLGAPDAPVDPDVPAADRFDWHDTTTSSSGHVMPQPPKGIVTADHLADTLVMSAGGVSAKGKGVKSNTDESVLWGAAEQIAAHGKPAQAAWLKAMLRKHPQLKNKAGVRKYIIHISESWMPFENTEGLLVLLGL